MKKAMIAQMIIFVVAWALMTPDTIEDNTHMFGLIGDVEVIKGNTIWVMLGAMVLSIINLWFWWPREIRITNIPETAKEASAVEDTKSTEAKAIDRDPKTPTMD